MTKKLIGFTGPARSGKDTCGAFFEVRHGYRRGSFASPIKKGVASMLGISLDELEHLKVDEDTIAICHSSMRYVLQTLGTEWGRNLIGEDVWVQCLEREFDAWSSSMVVTDVRFENEAAWIRSRGGIVAHVDRQNRDVLNSNGHLSEKGVEFNNADVKVNNNTDLQGLHMALETLGEHYDWLLK